MTHQGLLVALYMFCVLSPSTSSTILPVLLLFVDT
jgi:hypothetical protein